MINVPPGYRLLEPKSGLRLLVTRDLKPLVQRHGLEDFPVPPAADQRVAGPAGGRGAPWRLKLGETVSLVVKLYRRGGLAARFRGDTYRGVSRALDEVRVCLAARQAGLQVPEIQCLWMEQAGPSRYRLAAATKEIIDAENVFLTLHLSSEDAEKRQRLLAAVAAEVRKLHDAGIHHPDLNLGNILAAGNQVHLIDFDRARQLGRPLNRGERHCALVRIYRSLAKLSRPREPAFSSEDKDHFLAAYWPDETGPHTALRRRCRRELALHRLWWQLKPPWSRGLNDAGTP